MRDGTMLMYAQSNRRRMTDEEAIMWWCLRRGQMGERFRRQYPVGERILDFATLELKLNIEVDGSSHDYEKDVIRDQFLQSRGWTVLRFSTEEVRTSLEDVTSAIGATIEELRELRGGGVGRAAPTCGAPLAGLTADGPPINGGTNR